LNLKLVPHLLKCGTRRNEFKLQANHYQYSNRAKGTVGTILSLATSHVASFHNHLPRCGSFPKPTS
jgi:hypothetical protein